MPPDEAQPKLVLDASVAAKFWFDEDDSEFAIALQKRVTSLAPDFLFVEVASVAAKLVRRGLTTDDRAERALREVGEVVDVWTPSPELSARAYELARDHGVSVYDGLYLTLAESEGTAVLTADARLVEKVRAAGLDHLVRPLSESDPSSQT
jgi:predicted nucleic acid-binding protein